MSLLLEFRPEAVRDTDDLGRTPLHRAVRNNNPGNAMSVRALLAADAGVASAVDDKKLTPMHLAAKGLSGESSGTDVDVFAALLAACPAAASQPVDTGRLPLHYALEAAGFHTEVVGALLDAAPQSAAYSENSGLLPLHLCCRSPAATPATVRLLLEAYPEAAGVVGGTGEVDVVSIAVKARAPADVVSALLAASPGLAEKPFVGGDALCGTSLLQQAFNNGAQAATVDAILAAWPSITSVDAGPGDSEVGSSRTERAGQVGDVLFKALASKLQVAFQLGDR